MDYNELRKALTISASKQVTIKPGTLTKSIDTLLTRCYSGQSILITNAIPGPGDGKNKTVVISGNSDFLNVSDLPVLASFNIDGKGQVQAILKYTLVDAKHSDWTFSQSFPHLPVVLDYQGTVGNLLTKNPEVQKSPFDELTFTEAYYIVTTESQQEPVFHISLAYGINFVGQMTSRGILGIFESIIGQAAPLIIYGTIHIPADTEVIPPLKPYQTPWEACTEVPGINLQVDLQIDPIPLVEKKLTLALENFYLYSPHSGEWMVKNITFRPLIAFTGTLSVTGANIQVDITVENPLGLGEVILSGSFSGVTVDNLVDLVNIAGTDKLVEHLPKDIKEIRELGLLGFKNAAVVFSMKKGKFLVSSTSFSIGIDQKWPIWKKHFEIDGIDCYFEINQPFSKPYKPSIKVTVTGKFEVEGVKLNFSASNGNGFTVHAELAEAKTIPLQAILKDYAPGLPPIGDLSIDACGITVVPHKTYSISALMLKKIPLKIGKQTISDVGFSCFISPGNNTKGSVYGSITIGKNTLCLRADHDGGPSGGWSFEGKSIPDQKIKIGDLITHLVENFGVDKSTIPGAVSKITLENLAVKYVTKPMAFHFTVTGNFPVAGSTLSATLNIDVNGTSVDVGGSLSFDGVTFILDLKTSLPESKLVAALKAGDSLSLKNLKNVFPQFDLSGLPEDLEPTLEKAQFVYEFAPKKELSIQATSKNYGTALFVSFPQNSSNVYLFGLEMGRTSALSNISLTKVPLIGDKLPESANVSLENIRFIIASAAISKESVDSLTRSKLIPPGFLPADGLPNRFGFGIVINLGGHKIPVNLGLEDSQPVPPAQKQTPVQKQTHIQPVKSTALVARSQPGTASPKPPPTMWITVQKTFGPVAIEKIGVRYKDSTLFVLANLSFSAGGLTMGLLGLGIGSPIKEFKPTFTIDGLDLTFAAGPVEISGGLLGTLKPINFYGELIVKAEVLTIAALGGYAEIQDHPSFFLYAVLDYPIGGPSFFFVTGLAAGFGFNRKLLLPNLDGVPTFPLVEWAVGSGNPPGMDPGGDIGKQANDVLNTLISKGIIAPSLGEDWLAVGVRFTSFELVDSFALVTITFGNSFEVALLGISTLKIPPVEPVAEAQLAIKASFSPDEGLLAIAGQLTPNSYVLSKDARLTGGFAFYLWFGGELAGDFVVTLGGYSRRFQAPQYYPKVPRLGLNWHIGSELSITGDLYFALTSNAVMAGGGLSAVWHSGPIKAWFDVEADFLMVFKPFHYYISAGIHLGASFTVKVLFVKVSMTIHIGIDVEIWGPEFAGKAKVDLDIISFTISFGHSSKNVNTTIPLKDFLSQMLPQKAGKTGFEAKAALADPAQNADVVHIKVVDGLTKTVKYDGGNVLLVINPEKFKVETHSVIPSKACDFSGNIHITPVKEYYDTSGNKIDDINKNFGIGPTGTDPADFESVHKIKFNAEEAGETIRAVPIIQNVPKALWEKKTFDKNGVPHPGKNPLSDTTVRNVLTGYRLIPMPPKEDHTLPIEMDYLKWTIDENLQGFGWSHPYTPTTVKLPAGTVSGTIASEMAQYNRTKLIAAIPDGLLADTDVDISHLASQADSYLMKEPAFRLLGEEKTMS